MAATTDLDKLWSVHPFPSNQLAPSLAPSCSWVRKQSLLASAFR